MWRFSPTKACVFSLITIVIIAIAGTQAPGAPRSPATLTPDDLLAVLDWRTLSRLLPEGTQWWPSFPQFNVGIGDQAPGLRFYVVQTLLSASVTFVGATRVETTLLLYDSPSAAAQDFAGRMLEVNDKGAILMEGPRVGDQARYFRRDRGAVTYRYESTVRMVSGPFISRVTVFQMSRQSLETSESLARYAGTVADRIQQLLAGTLRAAPVPQRLASLMPPPAAGAAVGPVAGSAVMPPEAWAVIDNSGRPLQIRDALQRGGVTELAMRRYNLAADRSHAIEATLFFFARPEQAAEWQRSFASKAQREGLLNPGRTGSLAAFTRYANDETYEFQFAKGQIVGDVFCEAPFGKTSTVCESPVRSLAEAWYAALPPPR